MLDILKPILVKDPEKRISWEDLFKKDLTIDYVENISPS